jgi:hypothetical protein
MYIFTYFKTHLHIFNTYSCILKYHWAVMYVRMYCTIFSSFRLLNSKTSVGDVLYSRLKIKYVNPTLGSFSEVSSKTQETLVSRRSQLQSVFLSLFLATKRKIGFLFIEYGAQFRN